MSGLEDENITITKEKTIWIGQSGYPLSFLLVPQISHLNEKERHRVCRAVGRMCSWRCSWWTSRVEGNPSQTDLEQITSAKHFRNFGRIQV